MVRKAWLDAKKFYRIVFENFVWAIIILFANVLAYFDILIGPYLKILFGITSDSLLVLILDFVYVPIVLLFFGLFVFLLSFVRQLFSKRHAHLNLTPANNIKTYFARDGKTLISYGVGIKVHNPNSYKISECFATLELFGQFIVRNKKLVCVLTDTQTGMEYSNKLRWVSGEFSNVNCEASLAAESKENIVLVANIILDPEIIKGRGKTIKDVNISEYFNFTFCGDSQRGAHSTGLFRVKVRINGSVPNNPDLVEYFEGYIYSYIQAHPSGSSEFDIYWVENPLKDQRILNDPRVSGVL